MLNMANHIIYHEFMIAYLARAVEYTNWFSQEKLRLHPNECPGYDTKQSDGKAPVQKYPFISIAVLSTLTWSGSTW